MELTFSSMMTYMMVGLIGMAYFIYGKKQADLLFMLDGIALSVYPFFISGTIPVLIVGLILTAAPFVYRRYYF